MSSKFSLSQSIEQLATKFAGHFPETLSGPRTIGREAEFPVVDRQNQAADVRRLLAKLNETHEDLSPKFEAEDLLVGLDGPDFHYSLEVGWGTIEVITGPANTLQDLEVTHDRAMARLLQAAEALGYRVLGYGIQPQTPASVSLMSPKARYHVLHETIGDPWLWFTTTASDQVHLDITRTELIPLLNFGNLMSPFLIALCANSPVYGGQASSFVSSREGEMGKIHAESQRHGMFKAPFENVTAYVSQLVHQRFLTERKQGVYTPYHGDFSAYLEEHGPDFDAFLLHEHYIWNSARPRSAHATIEFRCACQQPPHEHMATTALSLALIEAAPEIQTWLEQSLGESLWPTLNAYHEQVMQHGLEATEPFPGCIERLLDFCEQALIKRGFGEETYLAPLHRRREQLENPGDCARRFFAVGGISALVDKYAYPTPKT